MEPSCDVCGRSIRTPKQVAKYLREVLVRVPKAARTNPDHPIPNYAGRAGGYEEAIRIAANELEGRCMNHMRTTT